MVPGSRAVGSVTESDMGSRKDDGNLSVDGSVFRNTREAKGLTRERLEEKSRVSLKTIRSIETKPDYRCKPSTLEVLAKEMGASVESLVQREPSQPVLLTSFREVLAQNLEIVSSAREILVTTGSRSRDLTY